MPAKFRYKAKSIFLTYSQCDVEKEDMLAHLKAKTGLDKTNQLLKCCIGQERHEDGGLHLHICAWYTHDLNFNDAKYLDYEGFHPNIKEKRIQRKKAAIGYCAKEDPNPLQYNMDIKEEQEARKDHRKILSKRICDGTPLQDLVEEGEITLFDLPKWEAGYTIYKRLKGENKPDLPEFIPNPWGKSLPAKIPDKKRHYWIWSKEPNRGKTTKFLEPLHRNHRARFLNKHKEFQHMPATTEAVLIDEYSFAYLKVTQLNEMCDGNYPYPHKNSVDVILDHPLIIVCSNKSIAEIYTKCAQYLYARFNEINVDEAKPAHWPPILNPKPWQPTHGKRKEADSADPAATYSQKDNRSCAPSIP